MSLPFPPQANRDIEVQIKFKGIPVESSFTKEPQEDWGLAGRGMAPEGGQPECCSCAAGFANMQNTIVMVP